MSLYKGDRRGTIQTTSYCSLDVTLMRKMDFSSLPLPPFLTLPNEPLFSWSQLKESFETFMIGIGLVDPNDDQQVTIADHSQQ